MFRSFRMRLALVAAGGLAVRWIAVGVHYRKLSPPPADLTDNTWYWLGAKLFAQGDGFANPIYWWRDGVIQHSAGHPPLYTAYLGVFSWLGFDSPLSMRLASGLLGAGCVVLVGLVARRVAATDGIGSDRAGLLAAGFAAIYPNLWINDGLILSESMYALLVAAMLWAAYRLIERPCIGRAAVLGLTVGLGLLTRSETQLLVLVLLVPVALWCCRRERWAQRFKVLAVSSVVAALVASPWVVKNLTSFEHPVILAIGAGFTAEVGNCDDTYSGDLLGYWSDRCGSGWAEVGTEGCREVRRNGPGTPPDQRGETSLICDESVIEQIKRERALDYISEHKGRLPVVVAARVGRIWNVYRPLQGVDLDVFFERRGAFPARAALWTYYLFGALAVVGAVASWRRKVTLVPLLAFVVAVTFTAASTFGITRYRVGAEVVWVVLAGVGVDWLWSRWSERRATNRSTSADSAIAADSASPTSAVPR